jgi:DNA mismatch repair protein MutS
MSTPLMKQYSKMKAQYPDTVLLFRLGDFYETFEEDARVAAKVLGITLTRRGNGGASDIPLAGFPHHALENYMPKLLRAGLKVAVCEQMEDPKFAKGLVKREVTEVVTPGAAFSDSVLQGKRNNYILSVSLPSPICAGTGTIGIAFADITTGEFRAAEIPLAELPRQATALAPAEILLQQRDREQVESIFGGAVPGVVTRLEDWIFTDVYSREILLDHFGTKSLKGFGLGGMEAGVVAAGALLHYLRQNQKANLPQMKSISALNLSSYMTLDQSTRRNLEIVQSASGEEDGTLFSVLDRTGTPMGGRLMKRWIGQPLRSTAPIIERLDAVSEFVGDADLRADISAILPEIGDLERLVARICTGRATPREVASLAGMLGSTDALRTALVGRGGARAATHAGAIPALEDLPPIIRGTLSDDPPPSLSQGGVIRPGVDGELDALRSAAHGGKEWIANMQKTERERTGISSLKVGFNNVFGYYIEITNTHRDRVPPDYIRKQTLTGAERYVTPELKEFEEKILNAEEKILALETRLFNGLRETIALRAGEIQEAAKVVATVDCLVSFAEVAVSSAYVRPEIDEGDGIVIRDGRHPVVERLLPPGEAYTPNDTVLDGGEHQIRIITGPNMSGKSSFLRQTGLIVLMAQIGSYVPATSARIGIVDSIFTRVGASDNIASGESTFLVEMQEAANIVNTATSRSLVLLDEVGRGTSTFDGISIAWALTEYLHDAIGARTLFATHYHELNEMASIHPRISNLKVDVREYGNRVIFLHKVTPGSADHSYGIHVGRMAGLPAVVTERAAAILKNLESSDLIVSGNPRGRAGASSPVNRDAPAQMTLFTPLDDTVRETILKVDPDSTTPIEALKILAELKKRLSS